MNQKIILIIMVALLAVGCHTKESTFYMPAEFEPQEAVWFGWSDNPDYFPVIAEVIKNLQPAVQVKVVAASDSLVSQAKQVLNEYAIDTTTSVRFFMMPGERYWIRDHGASFLINNKGELAVADFNWSLYGIEGWYQQKYDHNKDSVEKYLKRYFDPATGKVDSLMAVAENATIIKSNVVIEGGSIEVNGKGTLIVCEAVTMQRNPGKSKAQLEEGFKRALGVSKIIWMKEGLIDDAHIQQIHFKKYVTMGTGGHTDEFVRFADGNTVLLAWVDEKEINNHPFNKINFDRMSENFRILEQSTDQDGKPLRIIKVPLPDPIERKIVVKQKLDPTDQVNVTPRYFLQRDAPAVGDTLVNVSASSYMNYLVSNSVIILPTYTAQGSSFEKENQVRDIMKSVFPDRNLVWVECMPQNWQGGGIHCSTQQQPKSKNTLTQLR
jgi:agmatine deiminase